MSEDSNFIRRSKIITNLNVMFYVVNLIYQMNRIKIINLPQGDPIPT